MKSSSVNSAAPLRHVLVSLCAALTIAACGGGYGGGSSMGGGCGAYSSCTPTVTLSAPAASSNVSGTVTLSATAMAGGSYTVSSVQFKVDGVAVGTADTTAPFSYGWDSTSVADGAHQISAVITDSAGQTASSANVSVTVANNGGFALTLVPDQLFPVPASTATGSGTLSFNNTTGQGSGHITLSGMTATAVELGDAYAGSGSAAIATLAVNAGNASQYDIANLTLSAQQRSDLQAGKLYVVAKSAAFPAGELRAQLLPSGFSLKVAGLFGAVEVPAVSSGGSGQVALTVDSTGLKAAVHVTIAALTPTGAELDSGAPGSNGATLATLAVDATNSHHYFNESVTLVAADITNINAGNWYANVFSAAHATGELRGPAATLTMLQGSIFTARCSGCHTGAGASLPGVQNLTTGNTYANIVGVASIEQPAFVRIAPGDPDNSYLVLKVQGSAGISGVQMPASGAHLTQTEIDLLRGWVVAGAQNN